MYSQESNQAHWEERYQKNTYTDKNQYPYSEVISFVMRTFGSVEDKSKIKILELGCGWGNNLKFLNDKGFDFYGVDFSQTAVDYCNSILRNVFKADFRKLPFDDNHFDAVYDRMAVQCNTREAIAETFEEARRVLKPGGTFFSILVEKGEYDCLTYCSSKADVEYFTKGFSKVDLGYQETKFLPQLPVFRSHYIFAKK
jgi:ubiquinone/menaquinone biosynthesis C-methylase UbiE